MKITILLSDKIVPNRGCVLRKKKKDCSVSQHQQYSSLKKREREGKERTRDKREEIWWCCWWGVKWRVIHLLRQPHATSTRASILCSFPLFFTLSLWGDVLHSLCALTFLLLCSLQCVLSTINLVDEKTLIGYWIFLIDITDFST